MKLPQQIKENLLNELEFIIKKMREETDIAKKIYFYSAVGGAFERAMRFCADSELLIAQAVTELSLKLINDRVTRLKMGDTAVPLSENSLNQLIENVSELRQAIEEDKTVYPALEKTMEIAYASTGPGFYTRSFLNYVDSLQHG